MPIFEEDGITPITEEDGTTPLLEEDEGGGGGGGGGGGPGYVSGSMRQAVNVNELDGAIGTLPAGARALAFVGPANSGPIDTPAAYGRKKDVISTFGGGPLVEAVCSWIEKFRRPAIVVRSGASVAGSCDAIDTTAKTGTSVVTLGADTTPDDDYEAYFKVITGGTIGVAGITYQWSLDNGRTPSPTTALGTANTFVFPSSGGIGLAFGAGTLIAGDVIRYRANAPNWNSTELGTAVAALQASTQVWEIVEIVGPIDGTAFDALGTLFPVGSEKTWCGNTRTPTGGETEAAYLTALGVIFGARASTFGLLCAGAAKSVSGVTFRQYRRPVVHAAGPLIASVAEHIDPSRPISTFALQGVDIRDLNGNPEVGIHDELANPGLDDARFTCLTTYADMQGVYLTNPRLFSPNGSDFEFIQHRRVMNLAKRVWRIYFQTRTSQEILVDKTTGFILESEALEIEAGATKIARSELMGAPKVSDVEFHLSRTDNLLSTKKMTGQGRIIPLAYPKQIDFDVGFFNPALQVVAV